MMAPCADFSQYGLIPAKMSAVPIVPSSATPINVPASVPRPPVIAVPPRTTAVMHFSSRPSPALAGTSWKRTVASSAPIPTSMPATTKTQNTTFRREAGEPRRLSVGPSRIDGAAGRQIMKRPGKGKEDRGRRNQDRGLPGALTQAEPLKRVGQVLHPGAFGGPTQRFAPRHHGRQRHHNRRDAEQGDEQSVHAAERSPGDDQ